MQLKKRRTEITIETETLVSIRPATTSTTARCPVCEARRLMLTPLAAAQAAGISTRSIYRLVESGTLHASEAPDGQLFVCHASLKDQIERESR